MLLASPLIGTRTAACPSDEYCLSCVETRCTNCFNTYPDEAGICQDPTTAVAYCSAYSNATTCSGCEPGYRLNGNACTAVGLDNCHASVMVDGQERCVFCESGYINNTTTHVCEEGDCTISNCRNCLRTVVGETTTTSCVWCEDDYILSATATSCVAETDATDECWMLGTDGNCASCIPGHYMDANSGCVETDMYDFSFEGSAISQAFFYLALLFTLH